ncbi:MAG: hypothetical protein JST54_17570 [Deltaproteobacteria bacterium]|nr:hypothetical protein [Deltaproteobacteria bacterium]
MTKRFAIVLGTLLALSGIAQGEEVDGGAAMEMPASNEPPPVVLPAPAHDHTRHLKMATLWLSHAREASGTSWQPDSSPVYGTHLVINGWMLMFHYAVFGVFDQMYGPRGSSALFAPDWGMAHVQHELLGGIAKLKVMMSLEPGLIPPRGYPLLLQTGETYQGEPLHDVQHPHNLFMELALDYSHELGNSGVAVEIYGGPVGEPALGPTAFMHRESAALDPLAPITHHDLDSTHVSFGVVTAAVYTRQFKVESSFFNGHEPDEHRWGFNAIALNSWSARLQWAPCPGFVSQVSYGHLSSPELLEPGQDQDRFTASSTINWRFSYDGNWATTLAYGYKVQANLPVSGVLAETNLNADGHSNVFARFEWAQRTPDDLNLGPGFAPRLEWPRRRSRISTKSIPSSTSSRAWASRGCCRSCRTRWRTCTGTQRSRGC